MCLLFETLRIDHGRVMHAEWHETRMKDSIHEIWKIETTICLNEIIKIPEKWQTGIVHCNVSYGPHLESVTFKFYTKRPVSSLKLIECNDIDYHLKKSDRSLLDDLYSKRDNCDEIIIVKDGFITDTSISNLIFFDGKNWFTPETPLLKGTCRQRLLNEGKVSEVKIRVETFEQYVGLKLINAMRQPDEEEMIPISAIEW
jgi:4-amino-4-deoxychorismate lyase